MQLMIMPARFAGKCHGCGYWFDKGADIYWDGENKLAFHPEHAPRNLLPQPLVGRTVELSSGGQRFVVKFPYDPHVHHAIVKIPDASFKDYKNSKEWHLPVTGPAAIALNNFVAHYNFVLGEGVRDAIVKSIIKARTNIAASKAVDADIDLTDFGSGQLHPYPYQRGGIAYGVRNPRCIIADDMGLGKTVEGLGIAHYFHSIGKSPFPLLITTVAGKPVDWARHILGWEALGRPAWMPYIAPEEVAILSGVIPEEIPKDLMVVICHHDILAPVYHGAKEDEDGRKTKDRTMKYPGWQAELTKYGFRMVIIDEIHKFANPKAARSIAMEKIASQAPNVVGLTGTPFPNRTKEIIQPLKIIGKLDSEFGGAWKFGARYCGGWWEKIGRDKRRWNDLGSSNLDELHERLRATCYIRREYEEVKPEMPPKTRVPLPLKIDNLSEYLKAEEDLALWLGARAAEDKEFLQSIAHFPAWKQTDLKRERAYSAEMRARGNERLLRFIHLKQLSAEGKINQVLEWTDTHLEAGGKLILFAWHKNIQARLWDHLSKRLPGQVVRINSDDSDTVQQDAKDRFQSDPSTRVIIVSILMGSDAIDLYAANHVMFVEYGWGPGKQDQAEGRAYRDGQKLPVFCHYSVGLGTIDEEIMAIIDGKRQVTTRATKGISAEQDVTINALVTNLIEKYKARIQEEGIHV